jgi:hypothetical protein
VEDCVLFEVTALTSMTAGLCVPACHRSLMACHHGPDGGAFSVAGRAMQQIATAKGQTIFAKPGLPFKERFEIVSEQREDALVQHQLIPSTADNSARPPTQDMEARLAVAAIDVSTN